MSDPTRAEALAWLNASQGASLRQRAMERELVRAGHALRAARQRETETLTAARNAALALDRDGMSERKIGRQLGVNRKTVRKWLGKQTY